MSRDGKTRFSPLLPAVAAAASFLALLGGASVAHGFVGPAKASSVSRGPRRTSSVAFSPVVVAPRDDGRGMAAGGRRRRCRLWSSEGPSSSYVPPEKSVSNLSPNRKAPHPKIGDVVRYVDVDGGIADGQVLVGKISLIQPILRKEGDAENDDGTNKWLVDINELDDVGDGYYAEYPSRKRSSKRATRKLEEISPIAASFVRSEDAYKVPRDRGTGTPLATFERYGLEDYEGPKSVPIDEDVLESDGAKYGDLKGKLLRDAAIAGLAGTLVADLTRGFDDAAIYAAGAAAGIAYLFFLSLKTDTVGSAQAKFGSNLSNLRFAMPLLVLVGVALKNLSSGDANPVRSPGAFDTVTTEQFASAMLGFLTYRIPLFLGQIAPVVGDSASELLPGSAGAALRMAQESGAATSEEKPSIFDDDGTIPVLLVSGPPATGKTSLVKRLVEDSNGRFVGPRLVDKVVDGAAFERLEARDEFLEIDDSGRYGLTKEGILTAAERAPPPVVAPERSSEGDDGDAASVPEVQDERRVVVVDASVDLAKRLASSLSGARLVGVWVGLDSIDKFEERLRMQLARGEASIPDDDEEVTTEEDHVKTKMREVVSDIEYGVVSGIFEFTILNDDFDDSLRQLKEASEYCFK